MAYGGGGAAAAAAGLTDHWHCVGWGWAGGGRGLINELYGGPVGD